MLSGVFNRLRFSVENLIQKGISARGENPSYLLGAIAFFFFWILLATGVYLFFVYKLNIDGAYDSIENLSRKQPWWGGVIRSLHRYAADGLVIATVLHGIRVLLAGQIRHARWLAWVSGIVLLGILWGDGILGYWMVWDDRAQFIALKSAEFLQFLPGFGSSLPRAFVSRDLVTNFFFLIIIALHIVIPFILLILLLLHVSRITHPVINPPRRMMISLGLILVVFSLAVPALSGARADPTRLPAGLQMDWFYMAPYPLISGGFSPLNWLWIIPGTILLLAIPWVGAPPKPAVVSLALRRCNDCKRCWHDCPYEAIAMVPRTDGRAYAMQAAVSAELCISCGVCLGSCTTAALTLPEVSMVTLLTEIRKRKASRLVLLCEKAILPDLHPEAEKRLSPIWIPCLGAVHPALVEQASRAGVTEIMAAGCREGDCHYRTGARWFADRLARSREPLPRKSADLSRVIFGEVSSGGGEADLMKMERFLHGEGALPGSVQKVSPGWVGKVTEQLIWALPLLLVFIFSARSVYSFYGKNESLLVLSMKYTAAPEKCRTRTPEELAKLPAHMRTAVDCDRRRRDVRIRLDIDGKTRLDRLYKGGGVWHDGPIFVYEKFPLPPGKHAFDWTLAEEPSGTTFKRKNDADLRPGRMTLLELDSKQSP